MFSYISIQWKTVANFLSSPYLKTVKYTIKVLFAIPLSLDIENYFQNVGEFSRKFTAFRRTLANYLGAIVSYLSFAKFSGNLPLMTNIRGNEAIHLYNHVIYNK